MKFLDIPANHFSVRVASTDGLTLERHFPIASDTASVRHVAPSSTPGVFELSLSDAIVTVTPTSTALGRRLNSELGLGRAMLGELAELAPNGSAELRLAFFPVKFLRWELLRSAWTSTSRSGAGRSTPAHHGTSMAGYRIDAPSRAATSRSTS